MSIPSYGFLATVYSLVGICKEPVLKFTGLTCRDGIKSNSSAHSSGDESEQDFAQA
jgi:hypothetical protein